MPSGRRFPFGLGIYFRRTNPARYWLAFSRSPSPATFASRSRWYSCQVTLSTPGAAFFFSSPKLRLRFSGVSNRANPPNRCCLLTLALSAMAHREVGIAIPQFIVLADVSFVDCTVLSSASPGFWPQVLPDDLTPAPLIGSPPLGWRSLPTLQRETMGPPSFLSLLLFRATLLDPGRPSTASP